MTPPVAPTASTTKSRMASTKRPVRRWARPTSYRPSPPGTGSPLAPPGAKSARGTDAASSDSFRDAFPAHTGSIFGPERATGVAPAQGARTPQSNRPLVVAKAEARLTRIPSVSPERGFLPVSPERSLPVGRSAPGGPRRSSAGGALVLE